MTTCSRIGRFATAAHVSRYHWGEPGMGEPVNLARGDVHGIEGFDLGAAFEAIARAYLAAGDLHEVAS